MEQGYAIALFAGTPKGAAALTRDLADQGYAVSMSRDVRPAKGLVQICLLYTSSCRSQRRLSEQP